MAAATVACPRGRVAAFLVLIRDPVRCPTRHRGGSLRTASCEWQTALPSTASRFRNATAATASTPQSRHRLFGVPPHKDAPEGPKVLWKGRPWGRVRERCPSGLGPEGVVDLGQQDSQGYSRSSRQLPAGLGALMGRYPQQAAPGSRPPRPPPVPAPKSKSGRWRRRFTPAVPGAPSRSSRCAPAASRRLGRGRGAPPRTGRPG